MPLGLSWAEALGVTLGGVGWGLLVSALPHSAWGVGGGQATVVASLVVTRGLWNDCATDSSGVSSCFPLSSLLSLPAYLQGSRALGVSVAALGVPGLVLGGVAGGRRRLRAAGGALLLLAGLGALASAIWFGVAVTQEYFDPQHAGVRYEPGPGVLLAAGGGALMGAGGAVLLVASRGPPPQNRSRPRPPRSSAPSVAGDQYGKSQYV